jgi:hypothetical protein
MNDDQTRQDDRSTPYDEQRFRELGDRLVRCTDPEEQSRLKTELVRTILRGRCGRQQHAMRDFADRTIGAP